MSINLAKGYRGSHRAGSFVRSFGQGVDGKAVVAMAIGALIAAVFVASGPKVADMPKDTKSTQVWIDPEDGMRQWPWGTGSRWS